MQPLPDEDFNPYASPSAEPSRRDGEAPDDSEGTGLTEGITVEGIVSPKDLVRGGDADSRSAPQDAIGCALVLVFVFLPWGLLLATQGVPFALGGTLALVLILTLLIGHMAFRQARLLQRLWHARRGVFRPQRIEITNEGIRQETDEGVSAYRWTAFSRHAVAKRAILLHFEPPSTLFYDPPSSFVVIPRAFFASDAEWEVLLKLVKQKLPAKPRRKGTDDDVGRPH
ncbi:MAG: YcxB family protein [Planctomycetota bacterium]|jgi:hypothetical protein